jgi:endonuclease/exonuclease/phosphatase (EEP) superfamily protein YafD
MSRSDPNAARTAEAAADVEHAQVAALAAKVTALPKHAAQPADNAQSSAVPGRAANLSRWWRLVLSIAWLATLTLGLIAVLRVFYHDGTHLLTWLNAFTRYVYLPAYLCLIWALWKRRWRLALANLAIVSCHLYWLAPDFLRDRRFDTADAATISEHSAEQSLRIFFANVRVANLERAPLLREIRDANPDVVVIVEFSQIWYVAFRHSPLIATFPYGSGLDQAQVNAVNLFSKRPLTSERQEWIAGRSVEIVEIPLGSKTLHLVGLHAPRPMDYRDNDYEGYWSRVVPLLLGEQHPLVVIGDCNATQYSLVYEQLKAGGLRSAHEDRGRGYATSWPNGQEWVPPIRIDQAFLSSDVECLGISEGVGLGSDHKPLILDVQIRD